MERARFRTSRGRLADLTTTVTHSERWVQVSEPGTCWTGRGGLLIPQAGKEQLGGRGWSRAARSRRNSSSFSSSILERESRRGSRFRRCSWKGGWGSGGAVGKGEGVKDVQLEGGRVRGKVEQGRGKS